LPLFSGSARRLIQPALKTASTAAAPAQDHGVAASGHLISVWQKAEVGPIAGIDILIRSLRQREVRVYRLFLLTALRVSSE